MAKLSSEMPTDPRTGKCYHTGCARGDVAPYILLCGDPERAMRIGERFDEPELLRQHREYRTITGTYHGIPLSVTATGIGCDNVAIAMIEHAAIVDNPTFIRIGSCGSPRKDFSIGDLVISSEAIGPGMPHYYKGMHQRPKADPMVLDALVEAVEQRRYPHHVGLTCTTLDFYAGQGRKPPGWDITDRQKSFVDRMAEREALNFEMEMYMLFALAKAYRSEKSPPDTMRAGGVCAIYAIRRGEHARFANKKDREKAELRCIKTGLKAIELLAKKDGRV